MYKFYYSFLYISFFLAFRFLSFYLISTYSYLILFSSLFSWLRLFGFSQTPKSDLDSRIDGYWMNSVWTKKNVCTTTSHLWYVCRPRVVTLFWVSWPSVAHDNDPAAFGGCDPSDVWRQRSCPLDGSSSDTTRRVIPWFTAYIRRTRTRILSVEMFEGLRKRNFPKDEHFTLDNPPLIWITR